MAAPTLKEQRVTIDEPEYENPVTSTPLVAEAVPASPHSNTSLTIALCGDVKIRGRMARHNWFITLLGNHQFDLRETVLPPDVLIVILKVCGDVNLIVPSNTSVSYHAIMLCGDRVMDASETTGDGAHVTLTFIAPLCGNLHITNE